jgi:hypothetical protein
LSSSQGCRSGVAETEFGAELLDLIGGLGSRPHFLKVQSAALQARRARRHPQSCRQCVLAYVPCSISKSSYEMISILHSKLNFFPHTRVADMLDICIAVAVANKPRIERYYSSHACLLLRPYAFFCMTTNEVMTARTWSRGTPQNNLDGRLQTQP